MLLVPQVTLHPFDKWVVDFVGPINPPRKRNGVCYIITAKKYLIGWAEDASVVNCTSAIAARFLFGNIVTQFVFLRILMSN